MKKNSISQIENGKNALTEQVTKAICREFNVDYIWLTTGEGEMFLDSDDDFMERIDRIMVNESDVRRKLFKGLINASDEELKALEKWIDFCSSMKVME
jgi:transcriptional regulator with XRE-family HTH domain